MTKFKYNKELSKIIDFYRLIEFSNELNDEYTGIYEKLKDSGYVSVVAEFYETHKELCEKNYIMTYAGLNPFALSNLFEIDEFKDLRTIEGARDIILEKSETELRKIFIRRLVEVDEVDEYLENPLKIFDVISSFSEDDMIRGRLSSAISKPKEAVREYLDFLFLFREDFEKVYNENAKKIDKKAKEYEKILNEKGVGVVYDFFKDFFDVGLAYLEKYDKVDLYVSLFAPIGVGFDNKYNFLILGIYADKNAGLKHELKEGIKVKIFKNLGDATRFKIFNEIGRGVNTNKDLAEACGVKKPTISYHMTQLISAGMISLDEDGRYMINKENIIGVLDGFIYEVERMR